MTDPAREARGTSGWVGRAVEDEAQEGLLLAEYAVRMRLKNRIIVDTMTAAGGVDPDAWADEARLMLGRLRIEAETSARRMDRERGVAELAEGAARHQHDYRAGDTDALERRRQVYRLVGRRLLGWENDAAVVAALLEAAREDATEEMDAAVRAAVAGDTTAPAEDDALLRERLRLVVAVDLPALEQSALAGGPGAGRLRRIAARVRRAVRLRRREPPPAAN